MDDKQCLDNARGQCDKDPDCYGVSWYPNNIGQKLKLCLSRDMVPKIDGWRTIMKGNHVLISFSFNPYVRGIYIYILYDYVYIQFV